MNAERWQRGLGWILPAAMLGRILHYADNLLFFEQHP